MTVAGMPCGVHLTGSMPDDIFNTPNDVWIELFNCLPGRLKRVPDGELGYRHNYVDWQAAKFSSATLRTFPIPDHHLLEPPDPAHVPQSIEDIKPLGFEIPAIESYKRFVAQREAGLIPQGVRFQVSLPSPIEAVGFEVRHAYQNATAPFYEQRMLETLASIQATIPARDLAVQWDAALTIGLMETNRGNMAHPMFRAWFHNVFDECMATLKRMAMATNPDVEIGYHLCYGDRFHQHFYQPLDTSLLVDIAQWLIDHIPRQISWIQMPVPKNRTDEAYFMPLRSLVIPEHTQLFLGLAHFSDLQGTKDRIAVAKKFTPKMFGVATECGLGRTPPHQLDSILKILKDVSTPYPEVPAGI